MVGKKIKDCSWKERQNQNISKISRMDQKVLKKPNFIY